MINAKEIGKRITQTRKKKGITQEDLAGLAEIDRSYLSEIENGKNNLSVAMLIRIAEALDIKASKLID